MGETPELDPELLDLLVDWEERRAAGVPGALDELCRGCPGRAEELRRRVESISRLDSLLALPRAAADAGPSIPGFEVLAEVGRGGMGVVYRARDVSLDRVVAVKVPFGMGRPAPSWRWFEREGRTLARLRHPNIVPVYAAGVAEGVPYIVMEYVPGGSLAGKLSELYESPARTVLLMSQVARAVAHAHEADVVHRDLKPSNILLDGSGQPLVSDFGVAALLAGAPLADPACDSPGSTAGGARSTPAAAGTPAYSPPESSGASPSRPTPSGDVWSMGVMLYECLAGRLPYPEPAAACEIRRRPAPGLRAIRTGVSRDLDAVVSRCLAADPRDRYATAGDLARDLVRLSAGRPVSARRRWWADAAWRRLQTGPVRAAAAVGIAASAVGVIGSGRPASAPVAAGDRAALEQGAVSQRLSAGGTYTFLGTEGHTGPFRAVVGGGGEPQLRRGDGCIFVTATGTELLELLPAVPCEQFELSARVRVEAAGPAGGSGAGLYFGFGGPQSAEGSEAWAAMTFSFSETGRAVTRPGTRAPTKDSRVTAWFGEARTGKDTSNVPISAGPPVGQGAERADAGQWQDLQVRVGPSGFSVTVKGEDGTWLGTPTVTSQLCDKRLGDAMKRRGPWAQSLRGYHPGGGVGLYAFGCRAAYKDVSIKYIK